MCDFNISTLNLNGARSDFKRAALFKLMDIKNIDVLLVQETHSCRKNHSDWRRAFNGEAILSHGSSLSGGVGVLFARRFLPISFTTDEIIPGFLLKVKAVFENVKLVFLSVYAPTNPVERMAFLNILSDCIANSADDGFMFLGGDFNCTVNPDLDRNIHEPHPASARALGRLAESRELADVWRTFNREVKQYTYSHSRGMSAYWHFNTALLNIRKYAAGFYKDLYRSEWSSNPGMQDSFLRGLPQVGEDTNAGLAAERRCTLLFDSHLTVQCSSRSPGSPWSSSAMRFLNCLWLSACARMYREMFDQLCTAPQARSRIRSWLALHPWLLQLASVWADLLLQMQPSLSECNCDSIAVLISDILRSTLWRDSWTSDTLRFSLSSSGDKISTASMRHFLMKFPSLYGFLALDMIQALRSPSVWEIFGKTASAFLPDFSKRPTCACEVQSLLEISVRPIEPLLHKLRHKLVGICFPQCPVSFKLSVYADDLIVLTNSQQDIDVLANTVNDFGFISSAKVNWGKSEALMAGGGLGEGLTLPGGLQWRSGGLRYLGVFLGEESFMRRNWEDSLEKTRGKHISSC
uniref:Endonuclease/exonuclease/phosphatase domain-containing protein n=1 Tax=Tetraodon nigroviridis TaxID=99883 RepID=H3BWP1_TETNG